MASLSFALVKPSTGMLTSSLLHEPRISLEVSHRPAFRHSHEAAMFMRNPSAGFRGFDLRGGVQRTI